MFSLGRYYNLSRQLLYLNCIVNYFIKLKINHPTSSCNQCCGAYPFFPGSGSRFFFRLRVNNIGSGSTQKILVPTGSGSEKQFVKISLDSAPDFYTKHLKNPNFNLKKASINLYFVPKTEKP